MTLIQSPDTIAVSIVMPCLNEAATIVACVERASAALAELHRRHGLAGEVIVADNGSTDGSQALARTAGARVVPVTERGYGAALQGGFAAAHGSYLVMGDSDCSYDFVESVEMVEALMAGAEVCMGSRFKGEIRPGAMPWKNRYIGNPVLSAILRLFFRAPISDAHCGLRALTRAAYGRLNLTSQGMEFASEMVLKASLLKLDMREVPVTLSPDGRGRAPHLRPWRDGFRHLFYMLMLSPTWLFLVPAAILAGAGVFLFAALLSNPAEIVHVGPIRLGDHWALVGSAALSVAVQTAIMGMAVLVIGFREGMRLPSPFMARLLRHSRLRYWLMAAVGFGVSGTAWALAIALGWIASDYGALNAMRSLSAALTLVVIGVQCGFGGFLLSVVAGNRMRHANFA